MNDYSRNGRSKNRIRFHVVLVSKHRKKVFTGIEQVVYEVFKTVEEDSDFTIIEMGIDRGDHIHFVIKSPPWLSPAQIVRRLKQLSSNRLWKRVEAHLKKFYWNRVKKEIWSSSYFVSTIGSVSDKTVLKYVKAQSMAIHPTNKEIRGLSCCSLCKNPPVL